MPYTKTKNLKIDIMVDKTDLLTYSESNIEVKKNVFDHFVQNGSIVVYLIDSREIWECIMTSETSNSIYMTKVKH